MFSRDTYWTTREEHVKYPTIVSSCYNSTWKGLAENVVKRFSLFRICCVVKRGQLHWNVDKFSCWRILLGKNCGSINLVCVGRTSAVHPEVVPFALDTLSKAEVAKRATSHAAEEKNAQGKVQAIREKMVALEKRRYQLRLAGFADGSKEVSNTVCTRWIFRMYQLHHHLEAGARGSFPPPPEMRKTSICRKVKDIIICKNLFIVYNVESGCPIFREQCSCLNARLSEHPNYRSK